MKKFEFFKKVGAREFNTSEIISLINSNFPMRASWGSTEDEMFQSEGWENKVIRFSVNGMLHKGQVVIALDVMDTFNIYLTTYEYKVVKEITDVYIDMLMEILDSNIETPTR